MKVIKSLPASTDRSLVVDDPAIGQPDVVCKTLDNWGPQKDGAADAYVGSRKTDDEGGSKTGIEELLKFTQWSFQNL